MVGPPDESPGKPARDRTLRARGRGRRAADARIRSRRNGCEAGRRRRSMRKGAWRSSCHDPPHTRRPRSRVRLASLHADADGAGAAADRQRRGRVPLHRRRPPAPRRDLVVVGEHPRPFASAAERGAGRAGARARARRVRRLHASAGRRARRAAAGGAAARADPRVLLGQRLDGGRSRAEARLPVLGQRGEPSRRSFVALHHAYHGDTVGAMSASEDSIFTRPFASMLFTVHRAHAPYCYRCPLGLERATCAIECLGDLERLLDGAWGRDRRRARRADAAGRGRHDRLAGGIPGRRPAAVRPPRRADDRRRSADRIRPDRPHVRVRARGGVARHHLPVEGADRRLPAARRDGDHRDASTKRSSATIARKTFFHGHSFTANPLACAVAIASLELFHETGALDACATSRAGCARASRRLPRCRRSATSASSAASASSSW